MTAVHNALQPTENQQEEVIDLRHYFTVIMRAKWRILMLAILTSVIAVFVVLSLKPVFRSTATLLIEAEQARAIKIEEVYGINSSQQEYYLTQFEILKSRSIAERVFDQLNLAQHPDFLMKPSALSRLKASIDFLPASNDELNSEQLSILLKQKQIDLFIEKLSISPVRKTQLVKISFETHDAALAAQVANAVGDAYINSQLEARLGITQKANAWLGSRLGELRTQLDESERRLESYRKEHNLVDIAGITSLDAQELENLNKELVTTRSRAAEAEAFLKLVQKYGKNDIARLESLPEITSHSSIQNVKREVIMVERKLSELSKVYGPKHPKMIAVQSELSAVKESLRAQIQRLVQGIEDEARTASQNYEALKQQFEQARSSFSQLSSVETEYRRLLREVQTNRQLFDNFLSRQKETAVTGDFDSPVARFTDRAIVTSEPVKPKKSLIVALVFVATIGFGIVIAFVHDSLNDTIKSSHDAETSLAQRVLGYVPLLDKKAAEQRDEAFFDKDQKMFAESVRSIRTSMSLLALDRPMSIIEVTSSFPSEGKTSTSMNLAYAFSALERVLIIDADMRKPTLGKRLGLPTYQAGLANYLAMTDSIDDCIVSEVKPHVDVMPAGAIPLNPLELLAQPRFKELLTELQRRYDKIIVDTPPVQAVSDALVISPLADAVVMVVKANSTRTALIKNSLAKLNQAHAKVFGVVLNQFDTKDAQSYYGQYGYYQAYEQSDSGKAA